MTKKYLVSLTIFMCAYAGGCFQAMSASRNLTIPNVDGRFSGCVLKVADDRLACTSSACLVPSSATGDMNKIKFNLGCAPTSGLTGFENPAEDVKVIEVMAKNTNGLISVIEDIGTPESKRMIDLRFCLFGKSNNLCGFAKTSKLSSKVTANQIRTIKKFIGGIEFEDAPSTEHEDGTTEK